MFVAILLTVSKFNRSQECSNNLLDINTEIWEKVSYNLQKIGKKW